MPRESTITESKATEPETKAVEAAPVETKPARGAKTAAIQAALKAHRNKSPKEIAELLTASGLTTTAGQVSNVKSLLASKRKAKAASAATVEAAAPAVPADAISLAALQAAKKLIQELGGVANAKQALNALGQLLD